jgi:hypothetical protein
MLVACRLAGLSALETYYVRVRVGAQCRPVCAGPLGRIGRRFPLPWAGHRRFGQG